MTDEPLDSELLSAHLDDELSASERARVDAALAADPGLAATHAELAEVRATLRGTAVQMPAGAHARMTAALEDTGSANTGSADTGTGAPVVELAARRRAPTAAAVAAVFLIIAGVVGGLGGSARIPAIGDLVAQHEAAASVIDGRAMPEDMEPMEHMDKMPMEDARAAALDMPADYEMADAFAYGTTVHLVYRSAEGDPVSVIRQNGEADLAALGDGSMMSDGDVEMWSAPMDDAYVVVVDGSGYYWTVISRQPHDDMMSAMMHDLPSRSPSMGDRLRDAAEAIVEPFRL